MADSVLLICFVNHIFAAHQVYGFIVHTSLQALVFTPMDETVPDDIHSEYYFGQCRNPNKKLRYKDTKTYDDLKGVLIYRGMMDPENYIYKRNQTIPPLPRCVYVRARSKYTDIVRYHAFKFNICLGTIIGQFANLMHVTQYFEWYLPIETKEGITWELYFYY